MSLVKINAENFIKYAPYIITVSFIISTTIISFLFKPYLMNADIVFYYWSGQQILLGNGYDVVVPNAPSIGTIILGVWDDPYPFLKVSSIVASGTIVFLIYLITKKVFDTKTAIIAQVITAINPVLHTTAIVESYQVIPTSMVFIATFVALQKKYFFAGLIFGLSIIIRYEMIFPCLGFLIFLIFSKQKKNLILMFTGVLIAVSPLVAYNLVTFGEIVDFSPSTYILLEWDNIPNEWYYEPYFSSSGLGLKDPNILIENYSSAFYNNINTIFGVYKTWSNFSITPLIPIIGIFPTIGGMFLLRNRFPNMLIPIGIGFILFLFFLSTANLNAHKILPVWIIFPILTAVLFRRINIRILSIILIFIFSVSIVDSYLVQSWLIYNNDSIFEKNEKFTHIDYIMIGKFLSETTDIEKKYVKADNALVAYYADSNFIRNYNEEGRGGPDSDFGKYFANLWSHPQQRHERIEVIPDYIVIETKGNIPKNYEIIYSHGDKILLEKNNFQDKN